MTTITPTGTTTLRYRVTCKEHNLDRTVDTFDHAQNLLNLHGARDHPEPEQPTLNLTAAAEWLLVIRADPTVNSGPAWTAALALWEQLTGLHDDAAVRYALHVRDTPTRAAVIPF